MASFPYTVATGAIPKLLKHVRDAGVPSKVTVAYLVSVGFKSSNDRQLVSILRSIGFIDSTGAPTETWKLYRDVGGNRTLAKAIRSGYPELFETYPDAQLRDDEAITNFIRGHSNFGLRVVGFAVKTFRALCSEADFEPLGETPGVAEANSSLAETSPPGPLAAEKPAGSVVGGQANGSPSPATTVNINIQLTLPASEDGKLYDEFFAAMKKHLFD